MLDEASPTLRTTRWIAHWYTSARRRDGAALNIFSVAGHEGQGDVVEIVRIDAEYFDDFGPNAFPFADKAEEKVLSPDVTVAELRCLPQGELQDFLRSRRERWRSCGRRPGLADDVLHVNPYRLQRDPAPFQGLRGNSVVFVDQAEKNVLCADKTVIEQPGFFLRQDEDTPGSVGEAFKHEVRLPSEGPNTKGPGRRHRLCVGVP